MHVLPPLLKCRILWRGDWLFLLLTQAWRWCLGYDLQYETGRILLLLSYWNELHYYCYCNFMRRHGAVICMPNMSPLHNNYNHFAFEHAVCMMQGGSFQGTVGVDCLGTFAFWLVVGGLAAKGWKYRRIRLLSSAGVFTLVFLFNLHDHDRRSGSF